MVSLQSEKDSWIKPSDDYKVPNITLNDPANRKVRVITIGAGLSGIMMAYKIQENLQNVEHVIYERNPSHGGTWYENRYPGCACDVPAHVYAYPWAPNPDWPRFLAESADIVAYLNKVITRTNLAQYIRVNHQVAGCYWDDLRGKWKVKVQKVEPKKDWSSKEPLKVLEEFEDECDVLLHATGILNRWDYPNIGGLQNFKGRVLHTAGWPDDYGPEQWSGENVVVIGSGASSVQVVPTIQPHVKHLDVFVRTPIWFVQIIDNFGNNHDYSDEERLFYRQNPDKLMEHIKTLDDAFNVMFDHNIIGSPEQKSLVQIIKTRMQEMIKDQTLLKGILPKFPVGCRRMTPGDPYMAAIQKDNVKVHFTAAQSITSDGVVGADGIERKCDTIICATGFDTTHRPRFPIIGKNGINLQDKWKYHAEAYFGLACADMPNWITFAGPNWPVAQGSVQCALDANGDYAIACILKLQRENLHSFTPSAAASFAYNKHTQTWAQKMVWGHGCNTWYKDPSTGRLRAVYAGSSMHYREMIERPRWEDFDIVYDKDWGRYGCMGIGRHFCQSEKGRERGIELSPYCDAKRVDPRMLD